MAVKCRVLMLITAELKALWLPVNNLDFCMGVPNDMIMWGEEIEGVTMRST